MNYLSEEQASLLVGEVEKREKLYDVCINDIPIWQLVRLNGIRSLQNLPLSKANKTRFQRISAYFQLLPIAIKDLIFLLVPKKTKVLFLVHTKFRTIEIDSYIDKYIAPLLPHLDNWIISERTPREPGPHAEYPTLLTAALPELAGLWARCFSIFMSVSSVEIEGLSKKLESCPELPAIDKKTIKRIIYTFLVQKKCWAWIIKRLGKPIVATMTTGDYAVCAAAHEIGAKCVEMQHGIVTQHYPLMATESALAVSNALAPDIMLLYGEHWRKKLAARGPNTDKLVISAGFPLLEYWVQHKRQNQNSSNLVICTLQGVETEKLLFFLSDAWKMVSSCGLKLAIKLHPSRSYERDLVNKFFGENGNVIIYEGIDKPSTYELLANARWHCSISSATHYDALAIGTPTIIIGLRSHEVVYELYENGHALLANTPEELAQMISKDPETVPSSIMEQYCAANGIERICGLMNSLSCTNH